MIFWSVASLFLCQALVEGALPAGVELLGRFTEDLRATWPSSGVRFQVQPLSETIQVNMQFSNCTGSCKYVVGAFLDCVEVAKFEINPLQLSLSFKYSTQSRNTIHELTFQKLTETSCGEAEGTMQIQSLNVINGQVITDSTKTASICQRNLKMISFGDSITCGYGVDGASPCSFSAATEDVTHAYAYLIAQGISADIDIVAWSGKGIVRNCADPNEVSVDPLPVYYNRTLADIASSSSNYWSPKAYQPNFITVMLGQNDYSTLPHPTDAEFTNAMVNFLTQIKLDYPTAKVLVLCSPISMVPQQCPNIQNASILTNTHFFKVPDDVYNHGYGCDGHPNAATQRAMADSVIPVAQSILGISPVKTYVPTTEKTTVVTKEMKEMIRKEFANVAKYMHDDKK